MQRGGRSLGLLLALCLAACTPAPQAPLVVGTVPWVGTEPLFLARERGLFPTSVHLVEYLSSVQELRAFHNGVIDAAVVTLEEAVHLEALQQQARVVLVLETAPGAQPEARWVLVVRQGSLEAHPEQVDALLGGWFRALAFLREQPAEAARLMAPRLHLAPEQLLEALKASQHPDASEQRAWLGGDSPRLRPALERQGALMVRQGALPTPPAVEHLIDPAALQRVAP